MTEHVTGGVLFIYPPLCLSLSEKGEGGKWEHALFTSVTRVASVAPKTGMSDSIMGPTGCADSHSDCCYFHGGTSSRPQSPEQNTSGLSN